jgi:hypothetical protein
VVGKLGDHAWYRQVANSPRTDPEAASVKPFALALTPGSSCGGTPSGWTLGLPPASPMSPAHARGPYVRFF